MNTTVFDSVGSFFIGEDGLDLENISCASNPNKFGGVKDFALLSCLKQQIDLGIQ